MSVRELRFLDTNNCLESRTRAGRQATEMSAPGTADQSSTEDDSNNQLPEKPAEESQEIKSLKLKLEEAEMKLAEVQELAARETARAEHLQKELESIEIRSELNMFRALEKLRIEHQLTLEKEAEVKILEQKRMDVWIQDLKDSHQVEKEHLLERITALEKVGETSPVIGVEASFAGTTSPSTSVKTAAAVEIVPAVSAAVVEESATTTVKVTPTSASASVPPSLTTVASETATKVVSAVHAGAADVSASTTTPTESALISKLSPSATVFVPSVSVAASASHAAEPTVSTGTLASETATDTSVVSVVPIVSSSSIAGTVPGPSGVTEESKGADLEGESTPGSVIESFNRLLKAQTDVMAAQARAVAIQNLPSLACYTGEGGDATDDGFDRWLERFHERAKFACWSPVDQLYQLKMHLDKTALDVFRMLPSSERETFESAVKALKKRFKPADIEELRGLEFHHRSQGVDESIEQLGISIQQLGRKAFPSIIGKDFDRLLKGRFYQALLVKWQRKLGPPKPEEGFHDLFARARMLGEHEKQFSASASVQNRNEMKKGPSDGSRKFDYRKQQEKNKLPQQKLPEKEKESETRGERRCFKCKQLGHVRKDCPVKTEAPGRNSQVANTGTVAATKLSVRPQELTEDQLEKLLAEKRLDREQKELDKESEVNAVQASDVRAGAIGSLLHVDISIEGVSVSAMVDTGAQSTIISRSTLHAVNRHLKQQGQELPPLVLPTVRLYGKDGKKGGKELVITAEVPLTLTLGDKTVSVPVFVQPDSVQACLLGINAIPLLGISVLQQDGKSVLSYASNTSVKDAMSTHVPSPDEVITVSLVNSVTLPAQKGRVLQAKMSSHNSNFSDLLFEPNLDLFMPLGVVACESVVTANKEGNVWLAIHNHQGITAHLEAGMQLGTVKPTEVVAEPLNSGSQSGDADCSYNASVKALKNTPERLQELSKVLNLPLDMLSSGEASQLNALISEFSDVFALDESELGCTSILQHRIDTADHSPIKQQPYRIPMVRREKVSDMIDSMEKQGIVQQSTSPWASPVVLVPKKDGTLRFCVDYRRLNSVTRKDVYPLPRVEDILDALGGTQYFSTLDLASGYWQVELDDNAREKSAFTTFKGLYEFARMPFGLCNAPATFQRLMQKVLAGLEWKSCFVYVDDVLVASKTFEEHMQHLREVFLRLRNACLRLKPKKCALLRGEVPYLGYVVSKQGIKPDPKKTEVVKDYPHPVDVTGLRRFLGLASYYRRFVPGFASIAAPLHALTKKNAVYQWSTECEIAFTQLKELLTSSPVLAYPRFGPGHSFILETDASIVGLGAVLSQTQEDGTVHPVAFASRSVDKHERNYGISELETLGLVWAVRYFRSYLLGHPCVVYTDHTACLSILNTPKPSGKLARWALTIQEMDITIKHKSGKNNVNADALSRCPADAASNDEISRKDSQVCAVEGNKESEESVIDLEEVIKCQMEDSDMSAMITYLQDGTLPEDQNKSRRIVLESKQFEVVEGVLYHENSAFPGRWCLVVPEKFRVTLLEEAHRGHFAGHLAGKKTYDRLRRDYWWRGMKNEVISFCKACLVCASRKGGCKTFRPPLVPIPVGGPFHRVAVDILQLPLTAQGNCYVAVFMDYLTKWPEAFPIPDQKAETIAKLFVDHIVCRHGIPEELLSDRGANFISSLILEICKLLGVKKINTSGYHPQTDGLVEKFNSTLINMIAKSCDVKNKDWDVHLPCLLFAYRVSGQESTKESPFFLLYGRDARIPTETVLSHKRSPYAVDIDDYKEDLVSNLSEAWKLAKENIEQAQTAQKKAYDRKAREVDLRVGERVMVLMPSESQGKEWKLARPFYGPYRVLQVTPTNAEVRLVDQPNDESIFVALDRVRRCYPEQGNETWTGHKKKRKKKCKKSTKPAAKNTSTVTTGQTEGPVTRSKSQSQKKL